MYSGRASDSSLRLLLYVDDVSKSLSDVELVPRGSSSNHLACLADAALLGAMQTIPPSRDKVQPL